MLRFQVSYIALRRDSVQSCCCRSQRLAAIQALSWIAACRGLLSVPRIDGKQLGQITDEVGIASCH